MSTPRYGEQTPTAPTIPGSGEHKRVEKLPLPVALFILVVVLWAVVMSINQHKSLWHAVGTLCALMLLLSGAAMLLFPRTLDTSTRRELRFLPLILPAVAAPVAWVIVVGSHDWRWDIPAICAGVAAGSLLANYWTDGAWTGGRALERPSQLFKAIAAIGLTAWLATSVMDGWSHSSVVPHDPARFGSLPVQHGSLGVALSGGGYRAALYHAGVLHALEQLKLRPTHISSVSGGSIIGSFYANGGEPAELMKAVAEQRFNLVRDLIDIRNAPFLVLPGTLPLFDTVLFPWWSFSRLDVQANLLDDLLFGERTLGALYQGTRSQPAAPSPPLLLLNATDVNYGLGLGMSADGFLVASAANAAWVPARFPSALEGGRLARLTAISGAFPGAFPATRLHFDADGAYALSGAELSLADGGVLDNSGVRHLVLAHRLATFKAEMCTEDAHAPNLHRVRQAYSSRLLEHFKASKRPASAAQWSVDVIVASDGGKPFRPGASDQTLLESELDVLDRSVSLAGLHATVPVDAPCPGDPVTIWLYPHALVDADGRRSRELKTETIHAMVTWISQTQYDQYRQYQNKRASSGLFGWAKGFLVGETRLLTDVCACDRPSRPVDVTALSPLELTTLRNELKHDVEHAVKIFEASSTLEDSYEPRDAYALFRLGMYSVFEKSPAILSALRGSQPSTTK